MTQQLGALLPVASVNAHYLSSVQASNALLAHHRFIESVDRDATPATE